MRFQIGQNYKNCQVSSARIVANNILIIYMTSLKKLLTLVHSWTIKTSLQRRLLRLTRNKDTYKRLENANISKKSFWKTFFELHQSVLLWNQASNKVSNLKNGDVHHPALQSIIKIYFQLETTKKNLS